LQGIVLMKYLITSALPYINGVKHLGNLIGSMLPADVYARFLRQQGEEVLYICATDEHGTPAEIAAAQAGMDVATYCQEQHNLQAQIYQQYGLSFDYFGRTSSPQNQMFTQYFYQKLDEHGFIEERSTNQIYSLDDKRFLPDRYIIGTCPRCGYESARGDQCDNCASVLDPTALINPRSALSGSTRLESRESKHLFLKLSLLADEVKAWVEKQAHWPQLTKSIALKWLKEGLEDRGITRDLSWGVPVPRPGFEGKVFYVWFDAPIGYIGATKQYTDAHPETNGWDSWWHKPDKVNYTQFMAKDNVFFHTIMWPATMLGLRETWKLADNIKGFHWLTYYGGKFSTSQGRGVFMDQALQIVPADYWRYFLLAHAPENADSSFTWELFQSTVNKDLADSLGNFVNRTLKMTASRFGQSIPEGGEPGEPETKLYHRCAELVREYTDYLRQLEFRKATQTLRALWSAGNLYLDERAPWHLIKQDRPTTAMVLRTAINLIYLFALASWPIIPFTSEQLFDALHLTTGERQLLPTDVLSLDLLQANRLFDVPPPLFRKIDDPEVIALSNKYSGQ
jgi:methionyl-tRNA synthetase